MKKLLAILILLYPALAWGQTSPDQRPHAGQVCQVNKVNNFLQNQNVTGTVAATLFSGSGASLTALNATNLSSGTVAAARGGAGSISGALKGNGAGVVTQAACADLSNGAASCSTDTTNATNITSGTLPAAQLPNPTATTLGGIESLAATTHNFLTSISTAGVPAKAQPACADLSDSQTGCSTIVGTSATVNTGTSGATIPLNNGNNTESGNDIYSGTMAVTNTSAPTQGSGTLGIAGTATKPTMTTTAEGDIFLTAAGGINLIGDGSSFDFSLFNKSGTSVCTVATGTTNWNCTGLQVGGTAVLTANQSITLSGDASGSGTTAITVNVPELHGNTLTNTDWCTSNGTIINCTSAAPVTTWSAGTTGFTPNSGTAGAVTLAGTLNAANGGTGVANTATLTLGSSNQNWATLGTGIVKNTTTTGALTDAASADIIALFTGCSGSQYLGADGACHTAAGAGTVTSITAGTGLTGGVITTSGTIAEETYTLAVKTITGMNVGGL